MLKATCLSLFKKMRLMAERHQVDLHSHPGVGRSAFENALHAVAKRRQCIKLKCVAFENGVDGTSVDLEVDNIEYVKCDSPEVEVYRRLSSKSNK